MVQSERQRFYKFLIAALLLFAALLGWFAWSKSKTFLAEKERLMVEMDSLQNLRTGLETQLDSLSLSYNGLKAENSNLQGKLAAATNLVHKKDNLIALTANATAADKAALEAQITELKKAATEFETVINLLRTENESLKNENATLKTETIALKSNNENLNTQLGDLAKKLEDQIRQTQSAKFKATAFKVDVDRKNDVSTVKARKARKIAVTFDMTDVPVDFQGEQKLYLAISDEHGQPILSDSPMKVGITAPAGMIDVTAQMMKLINLEKTQRLSFTYELDNRLKKGNYVAAIYCNRGLLGVSSFSLR